jgi:hypothetical protein
LLHDRVGELNISPLYIRALVCDLRLSQQVAWRCCCADGPFEFGSLLERRVPELDRTR